MGGDFLPTFVVMQWWGKYGKVIWFGTSFIFPYIGNNHPNWRTHIFQRGRSTTNQLFSHEMEWRTNQKSLVTGWLPILFSFLLKEYGVLGVWAVLVDSILSLTLFRNNHSRLSGEFAQKWHIGSQFAAIFDRQNADVKALGLLVSMDWFKGKSEQETIVVPIKYGGFRFQFSLKPIHGW